mmetsp:Transcript_12852/g.25738  ORF Transcript_12852/g.25738 Transcript_12852/m.25738 type:complete len:116 (+) Transcript_12852:2214-2561(+)
MQSHFETDWFGKCPQESLEHVSTWVQKKRSFLQQVAVCSTYYQQRPRILHTVYIKLNYTVSSTVFSVYTPFISSCCILGSFLSSKSICTAPKYCIRAMSVQGASKIPLSPEHQPR